VVLTYGATEALPITEAIAGPRDPRRDTGADGERGWNLRRAARWQGSMSRSWPSQMGRSPEGVGGGALPLPPGEIGEIVVEGPIVSPAYVGRPGANALAKLFRPTTSSTDL
jgi:acyl-CoA synthetase (AMP-forming)/AMP-acid ligase II